jgi:hypothetical protein
LQAVDKKTVQDRELIVKAALTVAPGAAGAAPAAGSPAPASPAPAAAAPAKTN